MITDFARLSKIKELIDSFDHSYILWDQEDDEFKEFVYKYNKRVVEIPVSPSAEGFALLFLKLSDSIISNMERVNGEGNVKVSSVRVHETATGYAEAFIEDLSLADFNVSDIHYSDAIIETWSE